MILKEKDCNGDVISSWCSAGFKEEDALCNFCNITISCKHHGVSAVKCHASTAKHIAVCNQNRKNGTLQKSSQKRLDFSAPVISICNSHADNVCTAEIKFSVALAVKNVPYSFADTANHLFPEIFSDSKIAKDFKCCRVKSSYLISDGIGPYLKEQLIKNIRDSGCYFSIQVDETPLNEKRVQQMDILVRFYNEQSQEITVRHLESFHIGHGTADNMFDCITEALEQLPQGKLFSFYSDGPNVMISLRNKVKTLNPDLIDISTCSLHKVHNAFSAGLNAFGEDVERLLIDIYYFFKHSAAQTEDFNSIQNQLGLSEKVLLRHTSSRWLTLQSSVKRFIELFEALTEHFKKNNDKSICAKRIKQSFLDKSLLAKALFLQNVSEILCKFLEVFQLDAPLIHILYDEMVNLIKKLMGRFIESSSFKDLSGLKLKSFNVEDSKIWKKNVEIGTDTSKALSSLSVSEKKTFNLGARSFYLTCTKYLLKSLPLDNKILLHLKVLHPIMRTEECSLRSIKYLATVCPNVIAPSDVSLVTDEWIRLQSENLDHFPRFKRRIDHYWRDIFSICDGVGRKKFDYVSILVKALLSIPHGNADVERAFSINKLMLDNRSNLSIESINGIRQVKSYVQQIGGIEKFKVTPSIIKSAKDSYKQYSSRLEKESNNRDKRKVIEESVSKEKMLKIEELELEKKLKASQEMLSLAEKNVGDGIKKNNMSVVESGQLLLKESTSRIDMYLKALSVNRKEQALCADKASTSKKKKIKQK